MLALIIWFYTLNLRNFKQYHSKFIKFYYNINLTYERFMYWKSQLEPLLKEILDDLLAKNRNNLIIDSTHLSITKDYYYDQYKSLKKHISKGYSTIGCFFGFKLHVAIDFEGNICDYYLSQGKNHDLTVFKDWLLPKFLDRVSFENEFTILADRGYKNHDLHKELRNSGIFIDMKTKYRWKIESTFNILKQCYSMIYNRSRNMKSFNSHIYGCLIGYQLKKICSS